jgi:LmbE family N-acetylglucosaminyl deacetylase
VIDDLPTQGAVLTEEIVDSAAAGEVMAKRRLEDERYALFAEASLVFLDLPDAVFRGYEGDDELLATPRDDDDAPYDVLHREIDRLEPQKLYLPLGVGNHVDHQLCRDVGTRLLAEGRRWVMPGPDYAGIVTFYEDFPYAWWNDFERIEELPAGVFDDLPGDVAISPEYADITDQLERKVSGIAIYESQMNRLFGGKADMGRQTRAYGRKIALLGGGGGAAERYWATRPV